MAQSLRAHIEMARGERDEALRMFETLLQTNRPGEVLNWDEFAPLGFERLALARLLLARGDYRRSIDVANAFDSPAPAIHTLFIAESLRLRLEAATRLSNSLLMTRYKARLDVLLN